MYLLRILSALYIEMVRKTYRRVRGAGYLSPAEYFNESALQPASSGPTISSEPVPGWVRPPLSATTWIAPAGGSRKRSTRKVGGFAPAIMGSFVANAQSAVVPLVLYGLYTMLGMRKTMKNTKKSKLNNVNANSA